MDLTRDEMLKGRPLTTKPVELPGRGTIYVRELDGHADCLLQARRWIPQGDGNLLVDMASENANWTVAAACDASGAALFTWADLEAVKKLPAAELRIIGKAAKTLNPPAADAIEDAAKN